MASAAGACGLPVDFEDAATISPSPAAPLETRFRYCDGKQAVYQLSLGVAQAWRASLTDLGAGGRRSDLIGGSVIAYKITRPASQLVLGPQDVTILAAGVVNGATGTPGIAPGGLMAILGSGLAGPGGDTVVQMNGEAAIVQSASAFQITAQAPPDLTPGPASLSVQSPYGSAQVDTQVSATAPAIFFVSNNTKTATPYGVISNADGSMNSATNPGSRGQLLTIYCTGLGAGDTPVSVILNGVQIDPSYAGPDSGFIGLYRVDLMVPPDVAPGLDLALSLRQAGGDSNTVFVAIQ